MNESINEYQLLEELGQGSFGTVRRASQVHACGEHTFVAIKTMSKKRLKRKVKTHREGRIIKRTSELDNVRREIAIQRKLKHKNILRLIDALDLEDSDDLHMVLELAAHGALMKYDAETNCFTRTGSGTLFHEAEVLLVARQMVSGLCYYAAGGAPPPLPAGASSALLPHMAATWRDDAAWDVPHAASLQDMAQEHAQHIPMLRTLLGDAAVDSVTGTCVRLADLGVSHMFQEDAPDDMIKATAGTPAFHAPEMFTGGAFSGCKADIWALGCTLFAMLAGRMPVDGISSRSRQDHLGKALQDNDVRMDLVENCSGSCSDFLRQALCKDPAQRQDAKALAKHPWLTLHGILPPADEIMHDAEDKLLREPALSALASGGAPASSGPAMAAAARISADMQQLREAALSLQQQAMELMQSLGAARVGAVRALGPLQGVAPHIPLGLLGAREPVEHRMAPAATQSHMLQQETRSPRAAGCALGYAPAVTEAEVRGALTPVMSFHKLARLKLKAANAARRLSRIYAQRMAGKVVAANRVVRGFASGANAPPLDAAESSNES